MADNVISYKRSKETVTKSKLLISLYLAPDLRNHQKSLKKRTDHSIAICSKNFRFCIFRMVPGKSSCPGRSEYVWQRGVE